MILFLSGALTLGYAVVGLLFLRFWRRTGDGLHLSFAFAFWLFALNQLLTSWLEKSPLGGYAYLLRVLGFGLIMLEILRQNLGRRKRS